MSSARELFTLTAFALLAACTDPQCPAPFEKVDDACRCPAGLRAVDGKCLERDPESVTGIDGPDAGLARPDASSATAPDTQAMLEAGASSTDTAMSPPLQDASEPAVDGSVAVSRADAKAPEDDAATRDAAGPSCASVACGAHGKCVSTGGTIACHCDPGYQGSDCATDIDECAQAAHGCSTAYPCVNFAGGYTCQGQLADWPVPTHAPGLPNSASYRADATRDTVLDEITGLMWQRTPLGSQSWAQAQQACSALQHGGYDDWRLPSMVEHASLLIPQQNPCIDSAFVMPSSVWTSSPSLRLTNQTWTSSERYGNTADSCEGCTTTPPQPARCVRTHERKFLGTPASHYVVDAPRKTVFDRATGLTWQRDTDAVLPLVRIPWEQARTYCDALDYAGVGDWRLPTAAELVSTIDASRYNPAYAAPFMGAPVYAWARDESTSSMGSGMFVGGDIGQLHPSVKSATYAVRCVRSGQLP